MGERVRGGGSAVDAIFDEPSMKRSFKMGRSRCLYVVYYFVDIQRDAIDCIEITCPFRRM